ncbi:MAG: hypothetical protein AMS20_04445 [Gemmatimonas sp. SG8_28]|jgi:hypothetical protein|nr:MAG: hypothetical protein AMS20_04445 [Gemmatimonas sp. SG8_28]
MDYYVANLLEILIYAMSGLTGLWIVSRVVIARRQRVSEADLHQLTEVLGGLRDAIDAMRLDMGDIAERLEFTERVLGQIADDRGSPPPRIPKH